MPIKKLPSSFAPTIAAFLEAREAKRVADANARGADKALRIQQAKILSAMRGHETAICDDQTLVVKRGEASEPSLTMVDATKIAWKNVSRIIVGNREIKNAEVAALYGGKAGSTTIVVSRRPV